MMGNKYTKINGNNFNANASVSSHRELFGMGFFFLFWVNDTKQQQQKTIQYISLNFWWTNSNISYPVHLFIVIVNGLFSLSLSSLRLRKEDMICSNLTAVSCTPKHYDVSEQREKENE